MTILVLFVSCPHNISNEYLDAGLEEVPDAGQDYLHSCNPKIEIQDPILEIYCWVRCPVGQEWNGLFCTGEPIVGSWKDLASDPVNPDNICKELYGPRYIPINIGAIMWLLGNCSQINENTWKCKACSESQACLEVFGHLSQSLAIWTFSYGANGPWAASLDGNITMNYPEDNKLTTFCIRLL